MVKREQSVNEGMRTRAGKGVLSAICSLALRWMPLSHQLVIYRPLHELKITNAEALLSLYL